MNFNFNVFQKDIGVEEQDLNIKFAFGRKNADGTVENLTDFSICRDFLGDTVNSSILGSATSIYGFKYDPSKDGHLTPDRTILLLQFPEGYSYNIFLDNFKTWKKRLEKHIGSPFDETITKFENAPDVLMFECDPMWQKTTVGISFLSFLLKCLCWKMEKKQSFWLAVSTTSTEEGEQTKEFGYIEHYRKEFFLLLKNIRELISKHEYPHGYAVKDMYISTVHNRSGFFYALKWKDSTTVVGNFLKEAV